jgi:hypothetical protein
MKTPDPAPSFTPEDEALLRGMAKAVVDRGLALPASLVLEGAVPVNFILSQALAFFAPVVKIIYNSWQIDRVQELLEKRDAIPYILRAINELEEARRG